MFDILKVSAFNVDKFAHKFIQNLGLRIEPCAYKKFSKITFLTHIDRSDGIKQLLLYSAEKMKDINMQRSLDFSDERSIEYFMEKYANAFDKLTYFNNTCILTSNLRNINTKILQKGRVRRKCDEGIKGGEIRTHKMNKNIISNKNMERNLGNKLIGQKIDLLSPTGYREKYIKFYSYNRNKLKRAATNGNSELHDHDETTPNYRTRNIIEKQDNDKQNICNKQNLATNMIGITKKEVEMAEKFIQLYIKDVEYLKKRIQVELHIKKRSKGIYEGRRRIKYDRILCHHAILCLIEPSEQGFVFLQDDLSVVIEKYLLHGYKYHFEFQRHSGDYYSALLVLSPWAKFLVNSINTTMMRTICGILGCDVEKVLVLHSPGENL